MFRRIIAIIVVILLLASAGWLGYRLFSRANPDRGTSVTGDGTTAPGPVFPTGGSRSTGPAPSPAATTSEPTPSVETAPPANATFTQIVDRPVAGAMTIGKASPAGGGASTTAVIYVERQSGHVFQLTDGSPLRLSNTTIPQVHEALAGKAGTETRLIIRALAPPAAGLERGTIKNFSGRIITPFAPPLAGLASSTSDGSEDNTGQLSGLFLDSTKYGFSVAPGQDKIFSLEASGGNTEGKISDFDGGHTTTVFAAPTTEWRAGWPALGTIALQTKPASTVGGFLYWLDLKTKRLIKKIDDVPGLTTLTSPTLKYVLYSGSAGAGGGLIFGLNNPASQTFTPLPIRTITDKCVWSRDGVTAYCAVPANLPPGNYPEDWYNGTISFADNLWQIKAANGTAKIVYNPTLGHLNQPIDGTHLFLSADEQQLYLINRLDGTLWRLDLAPVF